MIREITRPSTARCTLAMYIGFLLSEPKQASCRRLGKILSIWHDSVLDKPYSQYMALVSHFWSGKHHRAVKGINLVTLYYTDIQGNH